MVHHPVVKSVFADFYRHGRRYCVFLMNSREDDFLYYSDASRQLRSLIFGKDFAGQLPNLMSDENLCIECGLGLSVEGGVMLDNDDLRVWYFTVGEANGILAGLKEHLGAEGGWILPF